ncbi:MAG TPA: Ni,Fe-hydrogenase I large subunit, partial [Gammaproteobacteria bacterium]|nr:Ni,Fe-hydrogenase I large subunit [Gammaproteobacteria bacterium]
LNPASQSSIATYQPSVGIGLSTAARGQLLHRVAVENSQIIRYQILAPTEWNFHPQGVVTQALQQLEPDTATVKQQASLIIHAIDPCVGYDLTLNPTGTEC